MKPDVLHGPLVVLAATLRVYARDGRASFTAVGEETGLSKATVSHHLHTLRAKELVAWDDGPRRPIPGSLRPLVKIIAVP